MGWKLHKIPKYELIYLNENMLYTQPDGDTPPALCLINGGCSVRGQWLFL